MSVLGLGLAVVSAPLARAADSTNALPKVQPPAQASAAQDAGEDASAPPSPPETSSGPETKPAPQSQDSRESEPAEAPTEPKPPPNPYLSIVERNPFGLLDPPPPKPPEPEPEPEPEVKPSALKLTGISTLLGPKHAMFVLQEPGKQPVYSGLVAEGESDPYIAGLEVLRIDPASGSVRVRYGGNELLLDFKNNGIEPPKAKAVARTGRPSAGNRTTGNIPRVRPPSAVSSATGSSRNTSVIRAGNRTFQTPTTSSRAATRTGGATTIPVRTTRTTVTPRPKQPPLSPAEQAILMRAQQLEAERRGIPMPPALPIPEIDNPGMDLPAQPSPGAGGVLLPPVPGQ